MAIGKPLLVQERKGVQQPVLAAQAQPLSANVPAQKLQFADYNIGMQSALASHAVGKELANMVGAGVQAKLYIDQTKQEYQRLNLMEEWQKADTQYNADFAKAMTPEAQQGVLDAYSKDLETRTTNWRKALPNTADSQKYLSFLRNGSQKQYSKFSTTVAQGLHKRTVDLEQLNIKRIAQSLVTEKNSDVVSGMNATQSSYANLVKIGALQPEAAEFAYSQLQDTVVNGRANLFATDLAKEYALGGAPLPTDEELNERLNAAMGMKLDDRRLTMARETYTDAFYKEVAEFNRQSSAEETMAKRNMRSKVAVFEAETDEHILSLEGAIPDAEWIKRRVEKAKAFDTAWNPGYSRALENKLNKLKWGESNVLQVERYTTGEGSALFPEAFHDLTALEKRLRASSGPEGALNEKTILAIKNYYRSENNKTLKDLGGSTDKILDSVLLELRGDKSVFDVKVLPTAAWDRFTQPLGSMDKVFQQDTDLMRAYQTVKIRLSQLQGHRQGPYSDDARKNKTPSEIMDLIAKEAELIARDEFGKVLATKKAEAKEAERKLKFEAAEKLSPKESAKVQESRLPKRQVADTKPVSQTSEQLRSIAKRQQEENRIRNLEAASKFDAQLQKGDWQGALGTAFTTKWQNLTQVFRDAHEQSKRTFQQTPTGVNDRKKALQDMAVMSKNMKQSLVGQIADKLGKAVGQGEEITIDGLANDMSIVTGWIGRRLIDGTENEAIEKAPIVDTKRSVVTPPDPIVTPTETESTGLPVVENAPTAIEELATGLSGNPLVGQLAEAVNSLVNPPNLEAATQAESTQFDPNVQGARYLTAEGQPTNVMPLEVRQQIMDNPEAYPQFTQYELVQGDMLGRIAKQAGISLEDLQNLNSNTIGRENKLRLGEKILLPAGSVITPSDPEVVPDKSGMYPPPKVPQTEPTGQMDVEYRPPSFESAPTLTATQYRSSITKGGKTEVIDVDPNWSPLEKRLATQEGLVYTPYRDGTAKDGTPLYSVGFGHQLTKDEFKKYRNKPVKYDQIVRWLKKDVSKAHDTAVKLAKKIGKTAKGNPEFIEALADVMFQGGTRFLQEKFPTAYQALLDGDWDKAASNIQYKNPEKSLNVESKWMKQSRDRALRFRDAILRLHSAQVTNIGMDKETEDLFSDPESVGKNSEAKLQAIRKLLMDKEGRIKEELESKELLAVQKHLDELLLLRKNLGLAGQELRTGEIQGKDIENYQLNRNPVYQGKDPQRNRRNI